MLARIYHCKKCGSTYTPTGRKWYQFFNPHPCPVCLEAKKALPKREGLGSADLFGMTADAMEASQKELLTWQKQVDNVLMPYCMAQTKEEDPKASPSTVQRKALFILRSCGDSPVHNVLYTSIALRAAIKQLVDAGEKEVWLEKQLRGMGS